MAGDLLRQRADGHRRAFGLAYGSLVAAWFLGNIPQTQQLAVAGALHHTFLAVGGLTILSSLSFWTLRAHDGESVSRGRQADLA